MAAQSTATDVTIEHYQRPEVKAAILRYCTNGGAKWRALNADEHWYIGGKDPRTVMLRGPADYLNTITRGRTLYATLDLFDPAVFEQSETWIEDRNTPERPIGDLSRCLAFTLSTDIDGIGDIRCLSVKEAVEAAAQFHCDHLREKGIEKNVHVLYSGGGIYVHLHHGLYAVDVGNTELTPPEIKEEYQVLTKAYNRLIGNISQAFFRKYPQFIGKVKFDQLNNQKRTFKTIFSIHKRLPYAVIPLDPKAIKISFERASLPLSDEVIAEGAAWYKTFDLSEKEAIVTLLKPIMEEVKQISKDRPTAENGKSAISRLPEPLDRAKFPPCIENIITSAQAVEGRHRALGILSTYLYQLGWTEDAAFDLWAGIANRCGVEPRIFETTFGRISCPRCDTIQNGTDGYPHLNLHNLGFCVQDEHCEGCQWPGDYHTQKILNDGCGQAEEPQGPTVVDAIKALAGVCDGAATKDGCGFNKFDREANEVLIDKATLGEELSPKEEKKVYAFLKKYKKQLKSLGIEYDDIVHIARGSSAAREDAGLNYSGQRKIIVTNRHMQDITAESLPELVAYNNPPRIFVKAGYLVQIAVDEKGITRIEILSESVLKSRLSRSARYLSAGTEGELTPTDAPGKVVKDILALPNWPGILPIVGLISSPVVRPDGSVIYQPGHDSVTGLFYTGNVGMALTVPDRPTQDEAVTAAAYIVTEVFGDFPFREQASRANTLAALLTTLTLPLIGGNIPLGLFDKPQAGTGASLLTEIIAELVTGEKANMQTAPDNDEEWRKAITAVLMQGPQIVVIDNVTAALKSSKLSQMLTARTWSDRLLGQTKMLNLPQTAAWFATGNNIQLGGDIARRSYWIRLDAASARPWLRDGFRHHDILAWVEEHRSELLSMLLTMVRAWIVAGKPKGTAPKIGSFVKWSQVIGGILTYAGVEGFLGNAADLYDSADQDIAQWDLFLDEWQKLHRDDKITSGMLKIELTDIKPIYKPFQSEMPEEIIKATDKGTRGAVGLGKALSRHADQVFPSGRKLTVEVDSHTKGKKWSVTTIKRSAVDEKGPEPQASDPFAVGAVVGLTPSPNQKENISGMGQGEENIEIITERKENRAGPTTASTANAYSGGPGHFTSTAKEDPALAKFKAQVQSRSRNVCRLCEQHFEIPLVIGFHGGGYICERCRRDGAPAAPPKAGSQVRVGEVKA